MAPATTPASQGGGSGASARFNTGYDSHVRDRYASRTVADSGMYLLPHLDKLYNSNKTHGSVSNIDNQPEQGSRQKEDGHSKPAFTFLDVGCGPGSITIDFAQRYPGAFFMGVDPGESFVSAATSRAAELGVDNVLFVVGDVFELEDAVNRGVKSSGLEEKFGADGVSFDVVSCHQVLSHLSPSQRGRALRNMHAAARKGGQQQAGDGSGGGGGIVAAREADIEGLMSIHPETQLLSQWRRLFYSVLRATHLSNEPSVSSSSSTPAAAQGTKDKDELEKRYPGLGSTFAGKYLLSTALSTGLWTRRQVAVTGSLNSNSEQAEKDAWVASIAPMLEDAGSSWNKRAVEYLTTASSLSGGGSGQEEEDKMRGLTKDEALRMMRDIAGAWRDWARDDSAWLGIGSCEIVCRC